MSDLFTIINEIGLLDYLIPFLIGFGVVYGMLEKTNIFGKNQRQMHVVSGFVAGLVVTMSWSARTIIAAIVPVIMLVFLFIFIGFLVIKWTNLDVKIVMDMGKNPITILAGIVIILVLIQLFQMGIFDPFLTNLNMTTVQEASNTEVTVEDLANPVTALMQPQILGILLIFAIFMGVSSIISKKK